MIRLKGISHVAGEPEFIEFHAAGRQTEVLRREVSGSIAPGLRLVAIGVRGKLPIETLEKQFAALGRRTLIQ